MTHGTVQKFSSDDGFGVIHPDDERGDLGFLSSSVPRSNSLRCGEHVEFDVIHGAKGPEAVDVRKVR